MKKIFILLLVLLVTACATDKERCYNCGYREEAYTVSEPTEIIYKNTTYKTVYEPKTYKEISYERRPYRKNCQKRNYCK